VSSLNKVNYVDQDFTTALTQVRNYLATNYPNEYNDYLASNLGTALLDIIAYAEQNLLWYLNRKVTDLYFPTAVTPKSISKLARLLGYKSRGATSAEASVTLNFPDAPYTFPVQINRGFQWQGPNNTVWEYRGNVTLVLQPGQTSIGNVVLSQGATTINNFVSDGTNNQFFELLSVPQGKFVDKNSVVVTIDGEEWTEQPVIPFSTENNFETNLLAFPPVVRFGDGVQGNIPPVGAGIQVTYVISDGFLGRITSQSIGDPVVGLVAQFQDIPVTVDQPLPSVGGEDPEDIRSITVNAPKFQRVQDRAITKDDYDYLSNGFDNVAKADAQIVRGVSGDFQTLFYLDSISSTVQSAVTGAFSLTESYVDDLNLAVSGIVSSTLQCGESLIVDLLPITSAISGSVDQIETDTNDAIETAKTNSDVFYATVESKLYDVDETSLLLIDEITTVFDVKNTSIESYLTAISGAATGTSGASTIAANITLIRNKLTDMRSTLQATATTSQATIDGLTDETITAVDGIMTEITSLSGVIQAAVANDQTQIAIDLGQIIDTVSGAASGFYGTVSGYLQTIDESVSGINLLYYQATSGLFQSVEADVQGLYAHLDEHLSDSCMANLVQVKVLGKDSNRKYVAPLQDTLDELKAYLEARKDIVHTISCVEGTADVINVNITIDVKVNENAVEDDVLQSVRDALEKSDVQPFGILVERAFNKPLYIWEIDGAIRDRVTEGHIDYLNIKIIGPAEYLDTAGNLISPSGSVLQAGTITVTALPRFV
jgi:hypothetical protein